MVAEAHGVWLRGGTLSESRWALPRTGCAASEDDADTTGGVFDGLSCRTRECSIDGDAARRGGTKTIEEAWAGGLKGEWGWNTGAALTSGGCTRCDVNDKSLRCAGREESIEWACNDSVEVDISGFGDEGLPSKNGTDALCNMWWVGGDVPSMFACEFTECSISGARVGTVDWGLGGTLALACAGACRNVGWLPITIDGEW